MHRDEPLRSELVYRPIGVVHSPFRELAEVPKQPFDAPDVRGLVEIDPPFRAGLADLEGFSHVFLLCHLHRAGEARLVVGGDRGTPRGVFATRNPRRPVPIGLSLVRLIAVQVDGLEIAGPDILDGTPLLDVKPYVPAFDARPSATIGWLAGRPGLDRPSDR